MKAEDSMQQKSWHLFGCMFVVLLMTLGALVVSSHSTTNLAAASEASVASLNLQIKTTGDGLGSATLEKDAYNSGEQVVVQWKGATAGDDLVIPTSITYSGSKQTIDLASLMELDVLQTQNDAYSNYMHEDATMTSYESLKSYVTSTHSVSLGAQTLSGTVTVNFTRVSPVYRMYNKLTSEHLFTTNRGEYDNYGILLEQGKEYWIGEGIDWLAPTTGSTVKRLYNAGLGELKRNSHYYTSDETEIARLKTMGWVEDTDDNWFLCGGTSPIYTSYSEDLNSAHLYTSSWDEWRNLDGGWDKEDAKNGIASDLSSAKGFLTCIASMNWKNKDNFYQVQHKLNGALFETQYLQGKEGDKTQAIALDIPGYKVDGQIEQMTIEGDSTIVEVNYISDEYSIVFNVGSDVASPATSTAKYGSKITKPDDPIRSGYIFDGWYYDSTCTKPVSWAKMPATSMTVYGHWTGKVSGSTDDQGKISLFDAKTGKVVSTSITDSDGNAISGATVLVDEKTGSFSVKLTEKDDSKTVIVKLDNTDGEVLGREVEIKDSDGTHKSTASTEAGGTTFKPNESTTDKSGTGSLYDEATEQLVGVKVTDSSGKPIENVKVLDDENGNLTITLPDGTDASGVNVHLSGEEVEGRIVAVTSETGVIINSGITGKTGEVEINTSATSGTIGEDGTVMLTKFGSDEVYEITLKTINDGNVPVGSTVILDNEGKVKIILSDSSFDEEQLILEVKSGGEAKSDVDATLYKSDMTTNRGHGKTSEEGTLELKTYSINYLDGNTEGATTVSESKVYTGLTISKPDTDPTKTGYKFVKWVDKATDEEFDFTKEITSDTNIYATWEAISYKIVFDAGEGSGTQEAISAKYDTKIDLPTCELTAPDAKTFVGWKCGERLYQPGVDTELVNLTATDGAEVTLTAVWGYKTNDNGQVQITNPADGKVYTVTINTGSGEDKTPVKDVSINYTDEGIVVISPNSEVDVKDLHVKVVKDEDQSAATGEKISVQKSDGEVFSTGTLSVSGEYTAHQYTYTEWTYDNTYDCHCTSTQTKEGTCSNCGDKVSETKEATGHTLVNYGIDSTAKLCTTCDHVIFGKYEQDGNLENGKEEIEWIKIGNVDSNSGTQELVSVRALDCVTWNTYDTDPSNIWSVSNMRQFLNDKFYNAAFSDSEKERIAKTLNETKKYQSDEVVETTEDNVFLLTSEEVTNYFADNNARICVGSPYALTTNTESGVALSYNAETGGVVWWTRSIGDYYYNISHILNNGAISYSGTKVTRTGYGTRPAINLKVDTVSVTYYNGNNGLSDDGAAITGIDVSGVVKGGNMNKPTDPKKQGYTFVGWYTDEALTTPFEFNENGKSTATLSVDFKLYAKWEKEPAAYFLASKSVVDNLDSATMSSVNAIDDATQRAKALAKAVKKAALATGKTYVSGDDLKADVATMKAEQAAGLTTASGDLLAKYKRYMDEAADPILLYTAYGSTATDWADSTNTAGADANKFVSFRIIQVGQHQYDADPTHLDGTALTFQATHSLPSAELMGSGAYNTGGWVSCDGTAVAYPKLQKNGEIYNRFSSAFTSEVKADTTKAFSIGGGSPDSPKTAISTSQDSFFLLSYSEIVGDATDYVSWLPAKDTEGAQYDYFSAQNIKGNADNTCLSSICNTRAGAMPLNGQSGEWWLRSSYINIKHCMQLCSASGNPSDNNAMRWPCGYFGIAPAFCF